MTIAGGTIGSVSSTYNGGRGVYERNGGTPNFVMIGSAYTPGNTAGNYDLQSGGVRIANLMPNSGVPAGPITGAAVG